MNQYYQHLENLQGNKAAAENDVKKITGFGQQVSNDPKVAPGGNMDWARNITNWGRGFVGLPPIPPSNPTPAPEPVPAPVPAPTPAPASPQSPGYNPSFGTNNQGQVPVTPGKQPGN